MYHDDRVERDYRRERRHYPRDDRERQRPMVTQEKLERQVYCHNFPFRSSWQDLKDYMRAAGEVEHVKIMEGPTGRSRGCAVVTFVDVDGAKKAVETLHGTQFQGRSILIRENRAAPFGNDSNSRDDSMRYRPNYQRNRYEEDHYYRDRSPPRDYDRHRRRSRSPPRSSRHQRSDHPVDEKSEYRDRGHRSSRRSYSNDRNERVDDR